MTDIWVVKDVLEEVYVNKYSYLLQVFTCTFNICHAYIRHADSVIAPPSPSTQEEIFDVQIQIREG